MSLLVRQEPETSYDDARESRAGHPRARRLLWPALVVVALVGAWALLPQAVRVGQDAVPRLPVDAGLLVPEFGEEGTYSLHYRHGETVTLTVPVENDGPLPLEVERAALPSGPMPLVEVVGDTLPLTVGPWDRADLTLTLRFGNCRYYHEKSADTWDRLLLEGSVLGRGFAEELTLAHPLAVHGQVIGDCPDRTLVRGDDVRR